MCKSVKVLPKGYLLWEILKHYLHGPLKLTKYSWGEMLLRDEAPPRLVLSGLPEKKTVLEIWLMSSDCFANETLSM
jgi:hypothetical protein